MDNQCAENSNPFLTVWIHPSLKSTRRSGSLHSSSFSLSLPLIFQTFLLRSHGNASVFCFYRCSRAAGKWWQHKALSHIGGVATKIIRIRISSAFRVMCQVLGCLCYVHCPIPLAYIRSERLNSQSPSTLFLLSVYSSTPLPYLSIIW